MAARPSNTRQQMLPNAEMQKKKGNDWLIDIRSTEHPGPLTALFPTLLKVLPLERPRFAFQFPLETKHHLVRLPAHPGSCQYHTGSRRRALRRAEDLSFSQKQEEHSRRNVRSDCVPAELSQTDRPICS